MNRKSVLLIGVDPEGDPTRRYYALVDQDGNPVTDRHFPTAAAAQAWLVLRAKGAV